jgi:adenylate cyclase
LRRSYFRLVRDLEPGFAGCYSGLALGRLQASAVYQLIDPVEAQSSAELFARQAVVLDGANADATPFRFQAVGSRPYVI